MTEAQVVELVATAMFDHFSKRKTWTDPSWSQIAEDARDEWRADARAAITACQHAIAPENHEKGWPSTPELFHAAWASCGRYADFPSTYVCSRSQGSSAFPRGQVKCHSRPDRA
jgi:hypothetical protein